MNRKLYVVLFIAFVIYAIALAIAATWYHNR